MMAIKTEAELMAILDRAIAEHFSAGTHVGGTALEIDIPSQMRSIRVEATIIGYNGNDVVRMEFK